MRQDWIEFEGYKGRKVCTRIDYIVNIRESTNSSNEECVIIGCSADEATFNLYSYEPYEQVKRKIMDAERVDYGGVVVERFTSEEFEMLEDVMTQKIDQLAKDEPCTANYYSHSNILDKLNKILKEDK